MADEFNNLLKSSHRSPGNDVIFWRAQEYGKAKEAISETGDSPVAFIIATNLQRRHLDKGQKIALALELEPLFAEEAARRRKATEGRPSKLVEKVPPVSRPPKSRDQAAVAVGLSGWMNQIQHGELIIKRARAFFDDWLERFMTWDDFVQGCRNTSLPEFGGDHEAAIQQVAAWLGGAAEAASPCWHYRSGNFRWRFR